MATCWRPQNPYMLKDGLLRLPLQVQQCCGQEGLAPSGAIMRPGILLPGQLSPLFEVLQAPKIGCLPENQLEWALPAEPELRGSFWTPRTPELPVPDLMKLPAQTD